MWMLFAKIFIALCVTNVYRVTAQTPPFPFGNVTGDIFTAPSDDGSSPRLTLPQPMSYLNSRVTFVDQNINGFITLMDSNFVLGGFVNAYFINIDTSNGGQDQNEVWLRVGNSTRDLNLARDIIAGTGTLFHPQAIIVATWYKVDAFRRQIGQQNTFQLIMPYSETGETWAIFAYTQLTFFRVRLQDRITVFSNAKVGFTNGGGVEQQSIAQVNSADVMNQLLQGTNCNRTGIFAFRINAGGPTKAPTRPPTKPPTKNPTRAPTKPPTKAPTRAPTNAPTKNPTRAPTKPPTKAPTRAPTKTPTKNPTEALAEAPATAPTNAPRNVRTNAPAAVPTVAFTKRKCGLFGGGLLCPLTLCGALGSWLGWCQTT